MNEIFRHINVTAKDKRQHINVIVKDKKRRIQS